MKEQQFSIQFVVLRDGEPITEIIAVEGTPISLHDKHDKKEVWGFQVAMFSALLQDRLLQIDGLAGVVPDNRRVGLEPEYHYVIVDEITVPILKRINRALTRFVRKLNGTA